MRGPHESGVIGLSAEGFGEAFELSAVVFVASIEFEAECGDGRGLFSKTILEKGFGEGIEVGGVIRLEIAGFSCVDQSEIEMTGAFSAHPSEVVVEGGIVGPAIEMLAVVEVVEIEPLVCEVGIACFLGERNEANRDINIIGDEFKAASNPAVGILATSFASESTGFGFGLSRLLDQEIVGAVAKAFEE